MTLGALMLLVTALRTIRPLAQERRSARSSRKFGVYFMSDISISHALPKRQPNVDQRSISTTSIAEAGRDAARNTDR